MTPLPLPGEPHMTDHFTDAHRQAANDAKQRAHNPQELLQHANLNLSQHAQERVLARLQQTPLNLRKTYLIAIAGKRPTTAIRAFCQMCIGYTRTQVANCSDPACPLFNYRPNW